MICQKKYLFLYDRHSVFKNVLIKQPRVWGNASISDDFQTAELHSEPMFSWKEAVVFLCRQAERKEVVVRLVVGRNKILIENNNKFLIF